MSVELLYKASYIKSHPLSYTAYVFICTLLSLYFSILFSTQYASILFICIVVFTQLPLFVQVLIDDEALATRGIFSLKDHPVFRIYAICMLSFGAAQIAFIVFMSTTMTNAITIAQHQVLTLANPQELLSLVTSHFFSYSRFLNILSNNYGVLNLIFVAAIIFGGGALFLLLWNMSVLVTHIIDKIGELTTNATALTPALSKVATMLFSLLPHAFIEFSSYVLIAVAGSTLGIALVRHSLQSKEFSKAFKETTLFYIVSVILIIIGAFTESLLAT